MWEVRMSGVGFSGEGLFGYSTEHHVSLISKSLTSRGIAHTNETLSLFMSIVNSSSFQLDLSEERAIEDLAQRLSSIEAKISKHFPRDIRPVCAQQEGEFLKFYTAQGGDELPHVGFWSEQKKKFYPRSEYVQYKDQLSKGVTVDNKTHHKVSMGKEISEEEAQELFEAYIVFSLASRVLGRIQERREHDKAKRQAEMAGVSSKGHPSQKTAASKARHAKETESGKAELKGLSKVFSSDDQAIIQQKREAKAQRKKRAKENLEESIERLEADKRRDIRREEVRSKETQHKEISSKELNKRIIDSQNI